MTTTQVVYTLYGISRHIITVDNVLVGSLALSNKTTSIYPELPPCGNTTVRGFRNLISIIPIQSSRFHITIQAINSVNTKDSPALLL